MAIPIDAVTIVSLFVQAVLYGLFVLLFALSSFVLLGKQRRTNGINKPMVSASLIMFILATIHLGVDLRRTMEAFLKNESPTKYLGQVNTMLYVLKSTAYAMQTLVGDGFVLYRLYLVWNGDKRICFPILICFIASIGVGIGALQGFARVTPNTPVFVSELHNWIVSFFSLTLFTNFSCTSLIAARIWWVHRQISGSVTGGKVLPAMAVIIESGAIYSACLIILLSLYLSGSFAQYIVLDAVTQVIGVVFSLIIVRVGLGLSSEATNPGKPRTKLTLFAAATARDTGITGTTANNSIGMGPMAVNVSTTTQSHLDHDVYGFKTSGIHISSQHGDNYP